MFFFHHLLIFLSWELFQILSCSRLWESHPAANRGGNILDLKHLDPRLSQAQARWGNEDAPHGSGERQSSHQADLGGFPPKSPCQHFPRLVCSANGPGCPKPLGIAPSLLSLWYLCNVSQRGQGAQNLSPLGTHVFHEWCLSVQRGFLPNIPTF